MKLTLLIIACTQILEVFKFRKKKDETKQLFKLVQAVVLMNIIVRM